MSELQKIYERFEHLDGVFRSVDSHCNPFMQAARDLWIAIAEAVEKEEVE